MRKTIRKWKRALALTLAASMLAGSLGKIIYDKAVLVTDRDIADEDLWGIITDKEADRQNAEMSKFGQKQVVRFMEREKAAKETEFTSSLTSDSGNGSTEIEK